MYKKYQRFEDQYFATAQTLPANTNADGDEGVLFVDGTLSGLEVLTVAKTACALADTKVMTITLSASATSGGTYVEFAKYELTASGAVSFAAGELMNRITLPIGVNKYVKYNIATDDVAATGTFDAFLGLVPN